MTTFSIPPENKSLFTSLGIAIAIIIIVYTCAGCNVNKRLNKDKSSETKIAEIVAAFSQTITEQADTNVTKPTVSVDGELTLDELLAGDSIFTDTPELTFTTKKVKNKVKTTATRKAVKVPFVVNRSTVSTGTIAVNTATITQKDIKTRDVDKSFNWGWLWIVLIVILLFVLWRLRSRLPF